MLTEEELMSHAKDKVVRSNKKQPKRTLVEKRAAKQAKRALRAKEA